MLNQKRIHRRTPLPALLMASALCLGVSLVPTVGALANIPFNPPKGSAPKGRGGASRGEMSCAANPAEFTRRFMPLAPKDSNYGLTVAQRPTLFAYVPPSSAQKLFFLIKDEKGKVHYQTTLPVAKNGGIMRFQVPASAPPLSVDKRYEWSVAVLCSRRIKPDSPFVSSWIQRVAPSANLTSQLGRTASIEQATVYGKHGIWYETLLTLAEIRQKQPNNPQLSSEWTGLLSSVGLGEIASEPLQ